MYIKIKELGSVTFNSSAMGFRFVLIFLGGMWGSHLPIKVLKLYLT